MAKQQGGVSRPNGGLHTDSDASNQPQGTFRFSLNSVEETIDGQQNVRSNELANVVCTNKPQGFEIIGDRYIDNDLILVLLTSPITGRDEIGTIDKNDIYKTLVNTNVLNLSINFQCDIRYRLRRGKERVIYWVDANNIAKTFNLDRPYNFYNQAYQVYLKTGNNPDTYVGEKWDASSFDLIKTYSKVPFFSNVEILETGNSLSGSYNFAIQLVDEDLNPTGWITTSNTVNIYNDSTNNSYSRIRGSKNIDSTSQSFPRTSKSIKLTITNLDTSFPYYRVAIIRAAGTNGEVEKVLVSDLFSTSDSSFLYTGNDGSLVETALGDILIDKEVIFAPQHIEQIENKLVLANTKGKNVNFCNFQRFASKISANIAYKEVLLNNILSDPNIKNAKSTFSFRGYMPGEVYSFGIVYLFNDGTISPTFHIPGKRVDNSGFSLKGYEIDDTYLDIHNCSTENYWGKDSEGVPLLGKKIRHHRFPFRKEVTKPLVATVSGVTTINKYRLRVTVTLNPAWTPGPIAYPVNLLNEPLIIPYGINYQITGNPTVNTFNSSLAIQDLGVAKSVYDDVATLALIAPPNYGQLDSGSVLASTYQTALNERFLIAFTYESYTASSSINTDRADIFGIEFSNIEKPSTDIVGFYIVRNERLDDDRLILDNAFFGSMTEFEQYKSFGTLMPKQYYSVNNCGRIGNSGKTLQYYTKGVWVFNPEFQFFGKKTEYTQIEIEGVYNETSVNMPLVSNFTGSSCNGGSGSGDIGGSKGVYIDDVQSGTSYDPAINKAKNKDDDGFDLVIGYRNTNVAFAINNTLAFPSKKKILHLNAATYQNYDSNTFYNVSIDNKMGFYLTNDDMSSPLREMLFNTTTKQNSLIYGSLVRPSNSAYSNFITRTYYKEHNNPIMFGSNTTVNNIEIFNGDAQISALNLVSSVYYDMVVADRAKKNKVWKIVLGAVLVVVAVAATILTGGAATPLAVSLIGLAISYGVSLAASGIKFEQFKAMIDVDYEKGLKETVVDGGVFETVRDTIQRDDDTIRWFADRVSNVYIESTVPIGLRAGLTSGIPDFVDAPAPYDENAFRSYLTEKLTTIDRDQGSGRLYKGYASAEIYDVNLDYLRFNKQKIFNHLPIEYDCCSDNAEVFPLRIWWSQDSFSEEKIDNFRAFLPNNYKDIEGEHGEITGLYKLGNSLYILTSEGRWHLPQNNQERVTNEIVSFIGTGEFFNILPRKVLDDNLGAGGTQHKWSIVKTKNGVITISDIEHKVHLHDEGLKDISSVGLRNWFENNLSSSLSNQLFKKFNMEFSHDNNPANSIGVGYHSVYDNRYERVLITKRDFIVLPDMLLDLILLAVRPIAGNAFAYCLEDGKFYNGTVELSFSNTNYFQNKSWTISYSFHSNRWISWHSYLPNYYLASQNSLYSIIAGDNRIWKHNQQAKFQSFYGILCPYILEYVAQASPIQDSIIESIVLQTRARKWVAAMEQFVEEKLITFNKITIYNSNQSTGELAMKVKTETPNWYSQQTTNTAGEILISKRKKDWHLSKFRDAVTDYDKSLFTSAWSQIKDNYFIDKVPNLTAISFAKPWQELQSFKDKYIVIRLKFDTFDNVNLILNYSLEDTENTDS